MIYHFDIYFYEKDLKKEKELFGCKDYGPTFGEGHDLTIYFH